MTNLRVGGLSYLNSAVFFDQLELFPKEIDWSFDIPTTLGEQVRNGDLDVALLSVGDYLQVAQQFVPLTDSRHDGFGIGTRGPALSVFFFSRESLDALRGRNLHIAVTRESATSTRLLTLLLLERFGASSVVLTPHADPLRSGLDGALLIGNGALAAARAGALPYVLDLAEAWWEWQSRPFVFAVWAVRSDVDCDLVRAFADALARAILLGLAHAETVGAAYCARTGFSVFDAQGLARYVRNFQYRLGAREWNGLRRFLKLIDAAVPREIADLADRHIATTDLRLKTSR